MRCSCKADSSWPRTGKNRHKVRNSWNIRPHRTTTIDERFIDIIIVVNDVARICCEGGAKNYVKLFVVRKMTRNNTPNKVRVAATELPQLLSQNTDIMFGETTAQSRCQTLCSSKVNRN